ncbi:MAG TPA: heterodisulfide reductase-related iron-sulfur binding cluster [Syntrophorhabdus sp.]|nr:heterodisulfide reductase-related iron-sulfur binding cluster [Syntrophorhabdus sp.]
MEVYNKHQREGIWKRYIKDIPDNNYFLTLSCVLGAFYPGSESMIPKIYDLLGLNWGTNPSTCSGWTCCSGIAYHGDIMPIEGTLLTVARLWSIAQELGFDAVTTSCVTSFGIHCECKVLYEHEPGLKEKVDKWLKDSCGREFEIPRYISHVSDIYYRYRNELRDKHMQFELVEEKSGRPLRVVDHVGCHYSKLFPEEHSLGGADYCEVLSGMAKAWGGENVDYPERRHCCGMGFRQCMITPNRGGTMASVLKKMRSMSPFEPDLIITNCPGCQAFLDKEQWAIYEVTGEKYFIPVITYQELAGLLLGWDPYETVGIQFHTVPVEPLLDKIGIPYDKNSPWADCIVPHPSI